MDGGTAVSYTHLILDAKGSVDPKKLDPITFDPIHNVYRRLGEPAGRAFCDGKQIIGES